jgi:hypothetical protein
LHSVSEKREVAMPSIPRSVDHWLTRALNPGKALPDIEAAHPSPRDFALKLERLSQPQRKAVERVVALARLDARWHAEELPEGAGEAYAYRSMLGAVHWGFNSEANGPCIACGAIQ